MDYISEYWNNMQVWTTAANIFKIKMSKRGAVTLDRSSIFQVFKNKKDRYQKISEKFEVIPWENSRTDYWADNWYLATWYRYHIYIYIIIPYREIIIMEDLGMWSTLTSTGICSRVLWCEQDEECRSDNGKVIENLCYTTNSDSQRFGTLLRW